MSVAKFRQILVISLTLLIVVGGVLLTKTNIEVNAQGKPDVVPGKYIVVLKDTVNNPQDVANEMALAHGLSVEHKYTAALKGFSGNIPQGKLDKVKSDPRVQFVSEDQVVTAFGKPSSSGKPISTPTPTTAPSQVTPFGIMRIGANNISNKGTGIGVAVIDTGIDLTHPDLATNIKGGKNCSSGRSYQDGNGHGSHVAGTIAALDNTIGVVGVAPDARLFAVRVLDNTGSGTWASVICGIDWVTANAARYNIKVANMSLGGSGSSDKNCGNSNNDALHKAICRSRDAGVTYVVAAGNESSNASGSVPAAYDDTVITVSALADYDGQPGADDIFASFSNYGDVVDLGAPGVDIKSTWKGGGYAPMSGTSMATPHVAGSAALYIFSHPGATWEKVRDDLRSVAEVNGAGHTDSFGSHPEPVVQAGSLL